MSWFDGHDVDDISDDPNHLPDNTYKFEVVKADLAPTKDKSKTGITFRYQIIEGQWRTFFPLIDWVRVPDKGVKKDEVERLLSHLKMRLVGFGFSLEEIQKFGPDMLNDCIGRKFYGTTVSRMKDDRPNIRVVKFSTIGDGAETLIDMGDDDVEKDEPF